MHVSMNNEIMYVLTKKNFLSTWYYKWHLSYFFGLKAQCLYRYCFVCIATRVYWSWDFIEQDRLTERINNVFLAFIKMWNFAVGINMFSNWCNAAQWKMTQYIATWIYSYIYIYISIRTLSNSSLDLLSSWHYINALYSYRYIHLNRQAIARRK